MSFWQDARRDVSLVQVLLNSQHRTNAQWNELDAQQ
jgi:hypothetical protein